MRRVQLIDLNQAVLNWQNTVGSSHNGQLEAFLGMTLGDISVKSSLFHYTTELSDESASRVDKLLGDNYEMMIKTWMARNE